MEPKIPPKTAALLAPLLIVWAIWSVERFVTNGSETRDDVISIKAELRRGLSDIMAATKDVTDLKVRVSVLENNGRRPHFQARVELRGAPKQIARRSEHFGEQARPDPTFDPGDFKGPFEVSGLKGSRR